MPVTHFKLRQLFSSFWESKEHKEVPPIPLVPQNDPTTLFTGSGMQQLVPFLLGEPHPLGKKLYNIQPCFRSQDIEEVGDNRHTTLFEMMGNWSLGTYFKKEQIRWFWEFLTTVLKLPKERLYVSVFAGTPAIPPDEESYETWIKLGLNDNHIFKYGPEKNWWSRAGIPEHMPSGEPGGPDSEVFYEFTEIAHDTSFGPSCHPNCNCGRFMEIGNSVFMQYKKNADGTFNELPNKNVDFGGGIERILAAIHNDPDVFKTDIYKPIITIIEKHSGKTYSDPSYTSQMRVIADHMKAATFIMFAGIRPSNKEQGYFLRRLLRRSAMKMHQLNQEAAKNGGVFADICREVIDIYKDVYPQTHQDQELIRTLTTMEIDRFNKTIKNGVREVEKAKRVDGKVAFDLYQSYGFPLELTEELFREKGEQIDRKQFYAEFQKHKDASRSASAGKFKGGLADNTEQTLKYHTATHLLHQALFDVLGKEIRQEGSNITGERLRFDFYANQKPTENQIKQVERIVNEKIQSALPVEFKILPKEEALKLGAKSFFREKYPDMVKVYFIGDYSKEFCGGPHVVNTKNIGRLSIFKMEKIGSNLYRIYAK